ncbi:TonB-dependent receptor [Novosphingobium lentum]|uniref:TonB-dependent receptor n=1 Tax=Novosphingobium lentum TaxID=145287 RepID=UPI0009FCCC48|nr:TonB-dependent receptor [Novosphingobium lentum]
MIRSSVSLAALALAVPFAPAMAQETTAAPASGESAVPPTADAPDESLTAKPNEILVVATRLKGQVNSAEPPVVEIDEEQVASYGASSIQDLLTAISPQTGSGRGRGDGAPVVLLNGQRISSFRELRNYPPEAIRKVEVLPEEVALKYGFRPDQRVVNFILKDNFRSITVEAQDAIATGGGTSNPELEASLVKIAGSSRINLTGHVERTTPLTEAERGIIQTGTAGALVAGDPDPAAYRTLVADDKSASLNGNISRGIGGGGSISVNAALTRDVARTLNGLNTVTLVGGDGSAVTRTTLAPTPLGRVVRSTTAQTGAALNKPLGSWQLAATADYTHVATDSTIDRRADLSALQGLVSAGTLAANGALPAGAIVAAPADIARSRTDTATSLVTLTGRPARLPGGELSLTVKTGFAYSAIASNDTRNPGVATNLKRGDAQAGFSLDVPITSRREGFLAGAGDISLNFNGEAHHLSDFGTLYDYGAGLTWSPTSTLSLQATYIASDAAPSLTALGGPVVVTPGVAVYDFTRGQTVLATVTTGGNAALLKESQRDWKFAVNWQLPFLKNSNFIAEYFRNRSSNTTNGFPLLTPAVEAAFPGRVVRDAAGQIVSIDERSVTYAGTTGSRLRYGINLSGSFGKPDPNARQGRFGGAMGAGGGGRGGAGGPRGGFGGGGGGGGRGGFGGGGPGGPGGGGPGGGGDGRGRWNLSLYHTIQFQSTAQLTPGGPVLDLLNGDALSGGGVARHTITMEGGGFYRGLGLRLSGNYTGGSHIEASGLPGSTRLTFAPIATFDLRVFADLGQKKQLVEAVPFFKGARLSLRLNNVFDAQQRVTDGNGVVPLAYQPGYEDPRGRVISVEFRKQF